MKYDEMFESWRVERLLSAKIQAEKSAKLARLERLEVAIKQLADAKGRHNTAIAYAKLMEEFQNAE
jgi:hypothetical protein